MRLTAAPLLTLASTIAVVLGFDLMAALATHFMHVAYIDFMLPDLLLFVGVGFVLTWRGPSPINAVFYTAIAAVIEATAGRALATALDAEVLPPGTSPAFLALETLVVSGFTMFWGAIGIALALIVPHRRR